MKLEIASDYNRLATVQTKLNARAASIGNHDRAVAMSRGLGAANPATSNCVSPALALAGREDAHVRFEDLRAAERDYAEAVELLAKLQQQGAIQGTDLETLENARKELTRIRESLDTREDVRERMSA